MWDTCLGGYMLRTNPSPPCHGSVLSENPIFQGRFYSVGRGANGLKPPSLVALLLLLTSAI